MIIGSGLPPARTSYPAPRAACGDRFEPQDTEAMQENLVMLRQMKDIRMALGSGVADADSRLRKAEANLKLAQEPPRQFGPETHAEVKAFLDGGALPASLTEADKVHLTTFKKLADAGLQFVEPPLQVYRGDQDGVGFEESGGIKTTAPECAFLKLIAYKFHAPENQLHFCTMSGGMIQTATLRAEYLTGLDFFLEQSQAGQTFYKREKTGYEAIETASDFVRSYQDDPQSALVKAQPGDLLETARAIENDGYVPFRDAKPTVRETPSVAETATQVVVGGVLLRKRSRA